MVTREERDTRQRFRDRYGEQRTDAIELIERAVIGGDWGANGYTTVAQAETLGDARQHAAALRLGEEDGHLPQTVEVHGDAGEVSELQRDAHAVP